MLPTDDDTERTFSKDALLVQTICQCGNLNPFLIESALASGYTPSDLLAAGGSVANLLTGGVSISDLLQAGVSVSELRDNGVGVLELIENGASVAELVEAGISTEALIENGVSVAALIENGVSVAQLLSAGVSLEELLTNGITVSELLAEGVLVHLLIDAGANILDLATAGVSLTQLLVNDISVLELLEAGIPTVDLLGVYHPNESGVIFFVAPDGTGLVAFEIDFSSSPSWGWGCEGVDIEANGEAIGQGALNTSNIVNGCSENGIAASICDNLDTQGFDDWYLPSLLELDHLIPVMLNGTGSSDPLQPGRYWSSTQKDADNAFSIDATNSNIDFEPKSTNNHLRPIRAF